MHIENANNTPTSAIAVEVVQNKALPSHGIEDTKLLAQFSADARDRIPLRNRTKILEAAWH